MVTFTRSHPTLLRAWVIAAALLIGFAATASPVFAHSVLLETSPDDGDQLPTAPSEVSLTFNEDITDLGTEVIVTSGEGEEVNDGEVVIEGPVVTQALVEDLPEGSYTVTWRAVSADGHPISGEFGFTAAEGSGSSAEAPEDDTPTEEGNADTVDDNPDDSSGLSTGTWVIVGVIIAGVVVLIAVIARGLASRSDDS